MNGGRNRISNYIPLNMKNVYMFANQTLKKMLYSRCEHCAVASPYN